MYCPECGNNLNELEKQCREEFDRKHAQYFHNLEAVRGHQWYWRGAWIGLVIDFLLLCFVFWLGNWSGNGFLEIVHRIAEKSYVPLFAPFLFPIMTAMVGGMFGLEGVVAEKEQLYEKFKETWGLPENAKTTKEST